MAVILSGTAIRRVWGGGRVNVNTALELVETGAHSSFPAAAAQRDVTPGDMNQHDKSHGEMIEWDDPDDELDVDPGEPAGGALSGAVSGGLSGVDVLDRKSTR